MRTPAVLLAAAVVAIASPALAGPPVLTRTVVDTGYGKVRKHCDQHGRCWSESYRNVLLATYALAPPPRYATPQEIAKVRALMSARAEARSAAIKPRAKAR